MKWLQDLSNGLRVAIERIPWEERLVIGLVVLAVLVVTAVYAVRRVRSWMHQPNPSLSDHVSDFRRMRDAGQIDDKEFHRVMNTASQQTKVEFVEVKQPLTENENKPSPSQGG